MNAIAKTKQPPKLVEQLNNLKPQLIDALPKASGLTPQRFTRIVLTELRKNPKIGQCDPLSILGSVMRIAQLGLDPALDLAHLIPFGKECQVIINYKGYIDLVRRSDKVMKLTGSVVKQNDFFEYELGTDERLVHKPAKEKRGEVTEAWALARFIDGSNQFRVIDLEVIMKAKKKSKTPWVWDENFDEMALKTAFRRLAKVLPMTAEVRTALKLEEDAELGKFQNNQLLADPDADIYTPEIKDLDHERGQQLDKQAAEQYRKKFDSEIETVCKRLQYTRDDVLNRLSATQEHIDNWTAKEFDAAIDAMRDWK